MKEIKVLYEDNHVIVVVKPYNILSQADNTKDCDMLTLIKNYLKEKYNKPGNVFLGLVHRLDRPTGGVMVFAKTSKAASRLSDCIRKGEFHKKYYAVVHGEFDNTDGCLENYLIKGDDNTSRIVTNGGSYAKLNYKVVSCVDNLSLIDVDLVTGRHHQIRVQFANIGHPLYGDQRYGIQDKKQLALYAYSLTFVHPTTREVMTFIDIPHGGIWDKFIGG